LLYVRDFDQLQANPRIGASWEGYVIEEIRRYAAGQAQLYYYRTHGGAEVDLLLIPPSGRKICLEIKYDVKPTPSRGLYQSLADILPDATFVIVPYGMPWEYSKDIKIVGLPAFLESELPEILQ
jgi:hypothetical protein